jgi:hypothetical protein
VVEDIALLRFKLKDAVRTASALPKELKNYCVYEEIADKRIYLSAYIPFIGERYGQATKILFYGTAQNLAHKGSADIRKEYAEDPDRGRERLKLRKPRTLDIDVGPVAGGVLPALAGLALNLKDGLCKEDLAEVLQYTAVTNYYKHSLWDSEKRDLHPDMLPEPLKKLYREYMLENFIKKEIEILSPDWIFAFGEYPYKSIERLISQGKTKTRLLQIDDPAYILQGGGKKYVRAAIIPDEKAERLIDSYCEYIKEKATYRQYSGKVKQIKDYLIYYLEKIKA